MNRHRFSQLWIACLFFLPTLVFAQALEKVVAGAKKEGKVKVGITVRWMEGGKPGAKRMVELFQSRYPFLKVDYERVGGSRERERVLSELAAGKDLLRRHGFKRNAG